MADQQTKIIKDIVEFYTKLIKDIERLAEENK